MHHIRSLDPRSSHSSKRDPITLVTAHNSEYSCLSENTKQHETCIKVSYGIPPDWQAKRGSLGCCVGWIELEHMSTLQEKDGFCFQQMM